MCALLVFLGGGRDRHLNIRCKHTLPKCLLSSRGRNVHMYHVHNPKISVSLIPMHNTGLPLVHVYRHTFQAAKFMSDMGGSMGMCIGASFITAVEFVELLTDLIVLYLTKGLKSEKHKNHTHPESRNERKISDIKLDQKVKP